MRRVDVGRWIDRPPSLTSVAATLAIAAVYFAAAKLGLSMAFVADQVTAVWPPTGIALAAVLMLGPRVWPGIALGAFLANMTAHEPAWTAVGIATGNTLEALAGAWALQRLGFRPSLDRLRDVLALVVCGAAVSTTVSASIGVTSLCLGGVHPWARFWPLWWVWWIGDALGDLVVAPLLLVWASSAPVKLRERRPAEAAALLVGVALVSLIVSAGRLGMPVSRYPLHYAIVPFVIWAALRFGQRGTATVTFCASTLAIWSTINGWGPFAMATVDESLILLQLFMGVVAVTALILGAAITERNVAERRAADDYANLRLSEERLRLAVEAGRMGIWDWNIETGEVKWSENLEGIHGLPRGSFAGTFEGFQALVHPEDRGDVNRAITAAVERGTGYDIEFRTRSPDGSVRWMAAKGTVRRDEAGRPTRMLGVGMDVTDRRRLEEEVTERAAELADADRRKDEFLAMLSHELRNPLASLSTALHLLGRGAETSERFLTMADRQVKQLVRLVDDLLDVSRITQGKITLNKEAVVLADVVTRALETVRPFVDSHGHALTVSLPQGTVRLEADAERLAQVLANLLGNAVKYTPRGGSISLTAERVDDGVVIRVRDTGAGLPAELLPHIFDLFVQGDTSPDRARGGLGIGLTVVRQLVEMHGGRVEARSPGLGRGSEFMIRLPVLPTRLSEPPPIVSSRSGARAADSLRVLVVEDNRDAAESIARVLELWGHEVGLAFDGFAALEVAEQLRPDVILCDLGLPGMDGYVLARRLREHPAFGQAVLVALSGYVRAEDRRRALEAGFDHHFAKPPDLDALEDLLGRIARTSAEQRASTSG